MILLFITKNTFHRKVYKMLKTGYLSIMYIILDIIIYIVYNLARKFIWQPQKKVSKSMSAKGMCGIGYKQGAEFLSSLEKAGFDGDMIQKIINAPGNNLAEKLYIAAFAATNTDFEKFELIKVIRIEVEKTPPSKTSVLKAGKKYLVKVFAIKCEVTSEDCLDFLKKQNATLLGEDGTELLFKSGYRYQLPHDRGYVSFDELDNLFAQRDDGGVPVLLVLHAKFSIAFAQWENGFGKLQGLLCFCPIGE